MFLSPLTSKVSGEFINIKQSFLQISSRQIDKQIRFCIPAGSFCPMLKGLAVLLVYLVFQDWGWLTRHRKIQIIAGPLLTSYPNLCAGWIFRSGSSFYLLPKIYYRQWPRGFNDCLSSDYEYSNLGDWRWSLGFAINPVFHPFLYYLPINCPPRTVWQGPSCQDWEKLGQERRESLA